MNTKTDMSPDAGLQLMHDPEFRQQLREHDTNALAQIGYDNLFGGGDAPEIRVITSTQDTTYVQMPPHLPADHQLSASDLNQIQAAGKTGSAGTVGTAGSASTLGTFTSTASSGGCVGSVGSAGTAGSS